MELKPSGLSPSRRTEVGNLLRTGEPYATTLVVLVVDLYGTEALQWTAETLKMELEQDFHVTLQRNVLDRLMAGILLVTSDAFFKDAKVFVDLCNVLSGAELDPTTFDPADAEEIAWGISEALLLNPPDEDEPFTIEIRKYIGYVLNEEGISSPPDVLRIALRKDAGNRVLSEYGSDPELWDAIRSTESAKADAINQTVRMNLQALQSQLSRLQLENGSVENLLQRLVQK